MTGNIYALVALAEAIVSFVPAIRPSAVSRSRALVRRASECGTTVVDTLTASFRWATTRRTHPDAGRTNAARAAEAMSP